MSRVPWSLRIEVVSAKLLLVGMAIALAAAVLYQPCCWCGSPRDVASELLAILAALVVLVANACGLGSAAWSALAHRSYRTQGLRQLLGWVLVIAIEISLPRAVDLVVSLHKLFGRL